MGGFPKNQETFARVSGYVEQTDVHSPLVRPHSCGLLPLRNRPAVLGCECADAASQPCKGCTNAATSLPAVPGVLIQLQAGVLVSPAQGMLAAQLEGRQALQRELRLGCACRPPSTRPCSSAPSCG